MVWLGRLYFVDFGDKWLQTALKLDRYKCLIKYSNAVIFDLFLYVILKAPDDPCVYASCMIEICHYTTD